MSIVVIRVGRQSRIADVVVKGAMKMVGASLGDDVGGKPGVTAVLGAEVIRLHTELLNRVQRNILSRCRHERVVVLTAVEQIVTTRGARTIHRKAHSSPIVGMNCTWHDCHKVIRATVDRRQLGVARDDAQLLLPGQGLLADRLIPHVEAARELVGPFLGDVVRRVGRTRRVVQEERLVGRDRLRVLDEFQRLVGEILRQVIALLR